MTITIYKKGAIIYHNKGVAKVIHHMNGDIQLIYPSSEPNSPIYIYFDINNYDWYEVGDR